jgi:hypothetical protein
MAPILGIMASQITGHLSTNSYESIATVTVGSGGSSSISFSSIPSTFKHLQLRCLGRTTASVDNDGAYLVLNSDSGANYASHNLRGNGGVVSAGAGISETSAYLQRFAGGNQASGMFGVAVVDFLNYADTNKYKTIRDLSGYDFNGTGNVYFSSSLWQSTSAITSMTFTPSQGGNWAQYTSFALYGIRG